MGSYAGPNISEDGLILALDAGNGKSYSQNEHPNPLDIYGWYVDSRGNNTANFSTISRDSIYSPVGNTPLRMDVTGNDPHLLSYNSAAWNIAPALNGERWIVSVYVKANVSTTGEILIFGANSSGLTFVNGGYLSLTAITVNIGTEWTRVQHIHTMNNADVAFIHARLDGPQSGGAGQTVWWDGLQVERVPAGVSTPTPFNSFYTGANTIRDLIGSNNGTLTNRPTYNSSNGGSLSFDGVDDYNLLPTNFFSFPSLNTFTISLWFKSSQTTGGTLFGQQNTNNLSSATGWVPVIYLNTNGSIRVEPFWTASGSNFIVSSSGLNNNVWHNIVTTFNSGTNQLYVDSSYVTQRTGLTLTSFTSTYYYIIGAGFASGRSLGTNYFSGNISNFNFYNRALTASEIQQNYNALRGRFGI